MMFNWLRSGGTYLVLAGILAGSGFAQRNPASRPVTVTRGPGSFLGVGVLEIDGERARTLRMSGPRGVLINWVDEGSAAANAGLRPNDAVLEFNAVPVESVEQFIRLVRQTPPGRTVKVGILREGEPRTLSVTMGQRERALIEFGEETLEIPIPPSPPRLPEIRMPDLPRAVMSWRSATLGIESEALGPQLAEYFGVKEGVLIRSVLAGSLAKKAGLKAGDVIVRVDEKKVAGPREVAALLRSDRARKTVPMVIVRERREMPVTIALEEDESPAPERSER